MDRINALFGERDYYTVFFNAETVPPFVYNAREVKCLIAWQASQRAYGVSLIQRYRGWQKKAMHQYHLCTTVKQDLARSEVNSYLLARLLPSKSEKFYEEDWTYENNSHLSFRYRRERIGTGEKTLW
jgi:hypothetical protein